MAGSEPAALPIVQLRPGDAADVWPLSIEAGWNQVEADWRLMIGAGRAFGIKDQTGSWIGSALALPLGPAISWISMVLVTKAERGKGHGTRLLQACIAEIETRGGAMGLDATEFGRPIYLPLGFRDVYALSRWVADKGARTPVEPPPGVQLRAANASDLPSIAQFDGARSGFDRSVVLGNLLSRAPGVARLAERAGGELAGFALGRDGHRATHIGPVVADDDAIALALLSNAVAVADRGIIADIPDRHADIGQWLQSQGASAPRRFMRMLRGTAPAVADGRRIFALAGPELA